MGRRKAASPAFTTGDWEFSQEQGEERRVGRFSPGREARTEASRCDCME